MRPVKVLDVQTLKERDNRPILEMSVEEMNEADEQPLQDSSWSGYTAEQFSSANRIELHMDYYDADGIFGPDGERVRIVDGREAQWDATTESVSIQLDRDDTPLAGEYYFEWVLVFDPEATDGTVPTSDTANEVSTVPSLGFYEISVEESTVRDLADVDAPDRTVGTLTVNRLTGPDGGPVELGSGLDARRTDVTGIADPTNNLDASNAQYVSSSINTHRQNAVHDQRQPAVPSSLDGQALGQNTPLASADTARFSVTDEADILGFEAWELVESFKGDPPAPIHSFGLDTPLQGSGGSTPHSHALWIEIVQMNLNSAATEIRLNVDEFGTGRFWYRIHNQVPVSNADYWVLAEGPSDVYSALTADIYLYETQSDTSLTANSTIGKQADATIAQGGANYTGAQNFSFELVGNSDANYQALQYNVYRREL